MWRSSSPGAYSLCSANSTLWPWCGLLCRPESTPSTTARARSFTPERRASDGASSSGTGLRLHVGEELVHQHGGGDTLGLGVEVGQHAVAQDGVGQRADVVHRRGEAALQNGARLGGDDQV